MIEATFIIRPERCLTNERVKPLVNRNAPLRLVLMTESQSASLMRIRRPSRVTPALLMRMSTLPQSARIFSAAALTAAASDTSTAMAQALRPSARTSPATFSEFSAVRDTQTTSAPSLANFKAIARPMPRPAPVTTAIWFSSCFMSAKPVANWVLRQGFANLGRTKIRFANQRFPGNSQRL